PARRRAPRNARRGRDRDETSHARARVRRGCPARPRHPRRRERRAPRRPPARRLPTRPGASQGGAVRRRRPLEGGRSATAGEDGWVRDSAPTSKRRAVSWPSKASRGFTLVETLVALAATAVILAALATAV